MYSRVWPYGARSLMWPQEQHWRNFLWVLPLALRARNCTGAKNRMGPVVGCDWGIMEKLYNKVLVCPILEPHDALHQCLLFSCSTSCYHLLFLLCHYSAHTTTANTSSFCQSQLMNDNPIAQFLWSPRLITNLTLEYFLFALVTSMLQQKGLHNDNLIITGSVFIQPDQLDQ